MKDVQSVYCCIIIFNWENESKQKNFSIIEKFNGNTYRIIQHATSNREKTWQTHELYFNQNPKFSDNSVRSESMGLWTLAIVRYSRHLESSRKS
jgi:hypothetical protein